MEGKAATAAVDLSPLERRHANAIETCNAKYKAAYGDLGCIGKSFSRR